MLNNYLNLSFFCTILLILIQISMCQHVRCGNSNTLKKGKIFERMSMNSTIVPFHSTITSTIHGCQHSCQRRHNCRCNSMVYYANSSNTDNNCFLFDFANVTDHLTKDSSAYVTSFDSKDEVLQCPIDCLMALRVSFIYADGIYKLYLRSKEQPVEAVCDMKTNGGGWTLLQRRFDGSIDFNRDWSAYKNGFGDLNGEFWLGLDTAHELTEDGKSTLRFDLWDGDEHAFAEYSNATIANETENYRINFNHYKGDAGDSMAFHNNMMFTTKDFDNDVRLWENCAVRFHGAWWHKSCHHASLNGEYNNPIHGMGLNWLTWKGHTYSLSATEIKIKHKG